MTFYLAALYTLFRSWPQIKTQPARTPAWFAVSGVFALGLDAGQLLPVLQLWSHADRIQLTLSIANRFVLHPQQITNFFWPDRFGSPFDGNFQKLGNYWEACCYLGIVPILCLLYGVFAGFKLKSRDVCFWAAIFAVSVILALGRKGGLYTIAFYAIPGVKIFHDPARFLIGTSIAGPMLAAMGMDKLTPLAPKGYRPVLAGILILVTLFDLAHFDQRLYPLVSVNTVNQAIAANSSPIVPSGQRVLLNNTRPIWQTYVSYRDFRRHDPNFLRELFATHAPNTDMLFNTSDASGYEPEPPKGSVGRFMNAEATARRGDDYGLDDLGVGAVVVPSKGDNSVNTTILRNHSQPNVQCASYVIALKRQYVTIKNVSPDEVHLTIPPVASPGHVTLAGTELPGWRVEVNGQPVPISTTILGLRQIALRPGASPQIVVFRYLPEAWHFGLYLTLLCFAILLGTGIHAVLSTLTNATGPRSAPDLK